MTLELDKHKDMKGRPDIKNIEINRTSVSSKMHKLKIDRESGRASKSKFKPKK